MTWDYQGGVLVVCLAEAARSGMSPNDVFIYGPAIQKLLKKRGITTHEAAAELGREFAQDPMGGIYNANSEPDLSEPDPDVLAIWEQRMRF
jgi:hypothetical protein